MSKFQLLSQIREGSHFGDAAVNNLAALGLPGDTKTIHILWMYPDVLNMHGGRGDAMALLHFSNCMGIPCEIRRINTLGEEIPFDWADMIFFQSGDLSCMEDLCHALASREEGFRSFAQHGGVVLAVASSGALLAEKVSYLDGHSTAGLGLLHMELRQRERVHGDDLWFTTADGLEIIGSQVQLADAILSEGQAPFGTVTYGRGNVGAGQEGARTGNVIFTHCIGPALVKNPTFTAYLLNLCADHAGVPAGTLLPEDTALETDALSETKGFIQKKMTDKP